MTMRANATARRGAVEWVSVMFSRSPLGPALRDISGARGWTG